MHEIAFNTFMESALFYFCYQISYKTLFLRLAKENFKENCAINIDENNEVKAKKT